MYTSQAKELILDYLKKDHFSENSFNNIGFESRCLFIDGPWGVGKTYLIKEILEEFRKKQEGEKKRKNRIEIGYFSLAGISSIDELEEVVASWYYPRWTQIRKRIPNFNVGSTISVVSFSADIQTNNLFRNDLTRLTKSHKSNYMIVFDELDRKCDSLDLNSVFALAMSLCSPDSKNTNTYHRVILINNDEAFIDLNNLKKINSFRNKISSSVIRLDKPDFDINKSIYKHYSIPYERKLLMNYDSRSNLRSLHRALRFYKSLKLEKVKEIKKQSLLNILINVAEDEESHSLSKIRESIVKNAANVSATGNAYERKLEYITNQWMKQWCYGYGEDFVFIAIAKIHYPRCEARKLHIIAKHFYLGDTAFNYSDIPLEYTESEKKSLNLGLKIALSSNNTDECSKLLELIDLDMINKRTIDPWIIGLGRASKFYEKQNNIYFDKACAKVLDICEKEIPPMDGTAANILGGINSDFVNQIKLLERTNNVSKHKEKNIRK